MGEGEESSEKSPSAFESGNTKIYVATETIRYCSIRKLIQIGCFNSRTDEQGHYASIPGVLKQYCSKNMLQYLKWRDIHSEKQTYEKEKKQRQDCVSDILKEFMSFIEKEAKENPVTLVFFSIAEYHELMLCIKCDHQFVNDFLNKVKSIVIYEHYKNKANDKNKTFKAIDELLGVKVRVYSCDKLAELLRQLFVESDKSEHQYHPIKPDFNKLIKILVSYPRILWNSQPKYLLLSSIRVNFTRNDWREDSHALPREEYRQVSSMLENHNQNCVTTFRTGMFRCNQPVIVKFRDLQEDTKSITYKGNLGNSYLAEGSCSLYSYNTVQFAVVVFQYQDDYKDPTDLTDSEYVQSKGHVDNEIDVYSRLLEPDKSVIQITEKPDCDISVKEDNRKFELTVADIWDRKKNVAIRKNILKSVLVKLSPMGQDHSEKDKDDLNLSTKSVFIPTFSSSHFKGLKIVNQLFCPVKEGSHLVRLVLTSTADDFTLHNGDSIGMAVPINQSNFGEAVIQAFQHEIDITEYIIEPFIKRRQEDEEYMQKKNNRIKNKEEDNDLSPPSKRSKKGKKAHNNNINNSGGAGGVNNSAVVDNSQVYLSDIGMRRTDLDTVDRDRGMYDEPPQRNVVYESRRDTRGGDYGYGTYPLDVPPPTGGQPNIQYPPPMGAQHFRTHPGDQYKGYGGGGAANTYNYPPPTLGGGMGPPSTDLPEAIGQRRY